MNPADSVNKSTAPKPRPTVLAVIPCYNHGSYVAQAIASVMAQTYPFLQLVVVNDGSTDDSASQIDALAQQYGFTVIHQHRQGVSAALNRGLERFPNVDYVAFLGADDYWNPDKVEKQIAALANHPRAALCYGLIRLFRGSTPLSVAGEPYTGHLFHKLLRGNFMPAMTVMLRREVLDAVGYFDETLAIEDWDMWLRVCHRYEAVGLNEVLTHYRRHDTNTSNNRWLMLRNMVRVLARWRRYPAVYVYPFFWLRRVVWAHFRFV